MLAALVACTTPPPERAHVFVTSELLATPDETFGGFKGTQLVVKAGGEIAWHTSEFQAVPDVAAKDAVVVQPAYVDGAPAAYAVTEIWENHPDPWVQPVYVFIKEWDPVRPQDHRTGAQNVFGVGTDSTFYSPYWRVWWAQPGDAVGPYVNVDHIAAFPMHKGAMRVCPITPNGVDLATKVHPFIADAGVTPPGLGKAYANGESIDYLDFGADRQDVNEYENETDGTVTAAELYTFAVAAGEDRTLLDLPAVLPEDAFHHAYMRRVDVVLTTEAVFIPASMSALRAKFAGVVKVPMPDAAIPDEQAQRYLLRVAENGDCFASATTFPDGCEWLDSEEAIEEHFARVRIVDTDVTLTATPVLLP